MPVNDGVVRDRCMLYDCAWTPKRVRGVYEAVLELWAVAALEPDRLAAGAPEAPGIGDKWGSYRHKRKRFENADFSLIQSFSMSHMAEPNEAHPTAYLHPDRDWIVYLACSVRSASGRYQRYMQLSRIPSLVDISDDAWADGVQQVAAIAQARYGYRDVRKVHYPHFKEVSRETPVQRDKSMNLSWWQPYMPNQAGSLLLRDVYAHNYLSDAYLDAFMGKTAMTLREWIEDDPDERGRLEPFTKQLTSWMPPKSSIPTLRETLFRAGRLFYWRFFNPSNRRMDAPPILQTGLMDESWQEPEPYYRPDIHEPWEATGPTPDIFRPDFRPTW